MRCLGCKMSRLPVLGLLLIQRRIFALRSGLKHLRNHKIRTDLLLASTNSVNIDEASLVD